MQVVAARGSGSESKPLHEEEGSGRGGGRLKRLRKAEGSKKSSTDAQVWFYTITTHHSLLEATTNRKYLEIFC